MRKVYLFIFFWSSAVSGYCQHSFTFDLFKGAVFIVKKNAKQPTLIHNAEKIFSGDKLVIANASSWVVLTNEKGESFKLMHKGEYTINSLDARITSLKDSPVEKYWTFIKKYFLPESNVSGGGSVGGGIDMQNNNSITFPPDSAVYMPGERIRLTIRKKDNAKKIRLIIKDPAYRIIIDTSILIAVSLDISALVQQKGLNNFSLAVSHDLSGYPGSQLSYIHISIDRNTTPECLADLYSEYPELKNNETDMALLVKAGVLNKNKYYAAAEKLRKKIYK